MKRMYAIMVAAILAAVVPVHSLELNTSLVHTAMASTADDANVLYRQKVMATIGALMKGLGCVLKKECALDDSAVAQSARSILFMTELSDTAFKSTTEGAKVKHTAMPEVWSQWNQFKIGLDAMSRAAAGVAEAATSKSKTTIHTSIKNLGKTCKSCHDTFRTK